MYNTSELDLSLIDYMRKEYTEAVFSPWNTEPSIMENLRTHTTVAERGYDDDKCLPQ
jgi:hypothetical protein